MRRNKVRFRARGQEGPESDVQCTSTVLVCLQGVRFDASLEVCVLLDILLLKKLSRRDFRLAGLRLEAFGCRFEVEALSLTGLGCHAGIWAIANGSVEQKREAPQKSYIHFWPSSHSPAP